MKSETGWLIFGMILGALLLWSFQWVAEPQFAYTAYVAPCKGQYCVVIGTHQTDLTLTKPESLEQATVVAKELNIVLNGRWSGEPRFVSRRDIP
jgi:hypothetical protein